MLLFWFLPPPPLLGLVLVLLLLEEVDGASDTRGDRGADEAGHELLLVLEPLLVVFGSHLAFVCFAPLPNTLKNPLLVTSMTGAVVHLSSEYFFCASTLNRDQSLSILTDGLKVLFLCCLKILIPDFPKYPGWYLKKFIL